MSNTSPKANSPVASFFKSTWEALAWLGIWVTLVLIHGQPGDTFEGLIATVAIFALPIAILYAVLEYHHMRLRSQVVGDRSLYSVRAKVLFIALAVVANGLWLYVNRSRPDAPVILVDMLAFLRMGYFLLYKASVHDSKIIR